MTMDIKFAYSTLNVKSIDDDKREFFGVASTPTTDVIGDIVEAVGADFSLPLPLLWQHRHSEPIGHVLDASVNDGGIAVRCRISKALEPGKLRDRLDEAWQSIKLRLANGLSIGFMPIEMELVGGQSFGQRFKKWKWLELSVVTVPANLECQISAIKMVSMAGRNAAIGNRPVVYLDQPPKGAPVVSGQSSRLPGAIYVND